MGPCQMGPESSGFVCLKGYDNVFKPNALAILAMAPGTDRRGAIPDGAMPDGAREQ